MSFQLGMIDGISSRRQLGALGGGTGGASAPVPSFSARLMESLFADAFGDPTPTFTRATVAYVQDWEGLWKTVLSGEARFTGARRVQNLVVTKSEDWTSAAWTKTIGTVAATTLTSTGANQTCISAAAITSASQLHVLRVRMSRLVGAGNIQLTLDNGGTWTTVTLTATDQVFSISQTVANPQPGIRIVTSGDSINATKIQVEGTAGQSNTNPSEYVSVGVLSAPYQGANVDGVQDFTTKNGNTVAANVVTEAAGQAIATGTAGVSASTVDTGGPFGYLAEGAGTQLVTPTASIRDMTDASWVAVTCTKAKTATGIDGAANSASTLTATGATSTVLQTLVAAATLRTFSAFVRRKTGTGTVLIKCGLSFTDITALINTTTYTQVFVTDNELNVAFGFQINTSGDAIEVDFNQFEAGAFATSPMASAGAARNADVLRYVSAGNINEANGSAYAEIGAVPWATAAAHVNLISSSGNGAVYELGIASGSAPTTSYIRDGGGNAVEKTGLSSPAAAISKHASSWTTGRIATTGDGLAVAANAAFSGGFLAGANFGVGCDGSSAQQLYGTMRNVRLYNRALSDTQLQAMTA